MSLLLVATGLRRGFKGCSSQLPKLFVSRILPVSSLLSTGCQLRLSLGGREKCIWMSWWTPRLSKSTGVHPANLSFEREVLFGHFTNWRWCMSANKDHVCWECVFGTQYWSSSQGICDSSVFWCVSMYSICVTGILVAFCKMWPTALLGLQRKLVKMNFFEIPKLVLFPYTVREKLLSLNVMTRLWSWHKLPWFWELAARKRCGILTLRKWKYA